MAKKSYYMREKYTEKQIIGLLRRQTKRAPSEKMMDRSYRRWESQATKLFLPFQKILF